MTEEIRNLVAWTFVDSDDVEQILWTETRSQDIVLLACAEGDTDDALGLDKLARDHARRAKIKVRKRRFQAVADLEVCDGRPTSPVPDPTSDPEVDDADA